MKIIIFKLYIYKLFINYHERDIKSRYVIESKII